MHVGGVFRGLPFAKTEDDPSADSKIILAVVEAVRQSGHEVLGLNGSHRDVRRDFEINTAAHRHREIILRARYPNAIGGANTSEKRLSEGRNSAPPEIRSRSK
jgi:hypothetical protein